MAALQPGHVKGDKLQCFFYIYQWLYLILREEI